MLDDANFWVNVENHVELTKPIYKMLRRHDSSAPTIGKVYSGWYELEQHMKGISTPYTGFALKKHAERWLYGHCDLAAAAYAVDPEFIWHEQELNNEVMTGFHNSIEKIGVLLEIRRKVSEDPSCNLLELWAKRRELIASDPLKQQTFESFPTYPTKGDPNVKKFCKAVVTEYAVYKPRKGSFDRD